MFLLQCLMGGQLVTKLSRRNNLFLHAHQKIYRVETAGGYDSLTFSSASQCLFSIDVFLS